MRPTIARNQQGDALPHPVEQPDVWTIGHWTCPEAAFVHPLRKNGIQLVVDVRAQPGSRRSPQFSRDQMPFWLADAGIDYVHMTDLGGRRGRQAVDPAINAGWLNASFKNYADYTLSAPYREAIDDLVALAVGRRLAIMCGEPMPWRCHRLLIANTLSARGLTVWHLIGDAQPRRHELGRWGANPSVDEGGQVTYPLPSDRTIPALGQGEQSRSLKHHRVDGAE